MITNPNTLKPDFTAEEVYAICDKFHAGRIVDGEKIRCMEDYKLLTSANLDGLKGDLFLFTWMHFRNASFRKSILERTNFSYGQILFCDFYKARILGANMCRASIHKANFRWANMRGSIMEQIDDFGSDYTRADLSMAILKYATLRNVNFSYADLRCVDFSRSRFYGVDFRGANIDGAKFEHAIIKDCVFDDDQKEALKGAIIK